MGSMDPEAHFWSGIITSSVVPAVIMSVCALLCLTFFNRLGMVVNRLRTLQQQRLGEYQELFQLEEKKEKKLLQQELTQLLHFLEDQTVDVLKRASYLRSCLFCLISAIGALVLTSIFIGLSLFYPSLDFMVVFLFILGFMLMLYGLGYAFCEIRIALDPIKMESGFVQELIKSQLEDAS